MRIALNDDEWQAMQGLPDRCVRLYLVLRRRMDFASGRVGERPRISYQALAEELYVEPGQGKRDAGSPTLGCLRWTVKRLAEAALLRTIPAERQLVFELLLADTDSARPKKVQQSYSRQARHSTQATQTHSQGGDGREAHPPAQHGGSGEVRHTSGIPELPYPSLRSGGAALIVAAAVEADASDDQDTNLPSHIDQGEDGGAGANHPGRALALPTANAPQDLLQQACRRTWQAYGRAYQDRYGTPPIRNARVNSQIRQFVRRLPLDEAPAVAAFYLGHAGAFYVRRMHDFGALLTDAEKLRTEWATGRQMTQTRARQQDRAGHTLSLVDEILAEQRGTPCATPY
jgi:hypothetical protein